MRILIVGGGISGLALAGFLKKQGHTLQIIEKSKEWGTIGYAVQLWNNSVLPLENLGLLKEFQEKSYPSFLLQIQDNKAKNIKSVYLREVLNIQHPMFSIKRADLHNMLQRVAGDIPISFNTVIDELYETKENVTVKLSNGTTQTYDLVVGCDGIHSSLREKIFPNNYLHSYQWEIWMDWFNTSAPDINHSMIMLGEGKVFGSYPVSKNTYCVMFFLPKKFHSSTDIKTILMENFSNFEGVVPEVLHHLKNSSSMFHDDLRYVDLDKWYSGRVVLLGDAQHAVSPLTGLGCSVAIEDAYVLSTLLNSASSDNIPSLLKTFARERKKRLRLVKNQSKLIWQWFSLDKNFQCGIRNTILPFVPVRYFAANMSRLLSSPALKI